jgi:hypothetical protein
MKAKKGFHEFGAFVPADIAEGLRVIGPGSETLTPACHAEMPDSWDACTDEQLEWLAKRGSCGQRLVAERQINDRAKARLDRMKH